MKRVGVWFLYEPSCIFSYGHVQSDSYVLDHIHEMLCELLSRDLISDFTEFHGNVTEVEKNG